MKTLRQLLLKEDWHSAAQDPRVKKAATLLAQVAYEHDCGPEDLKMLGDLVRHHAKRMVSGLEKARDTRHSERDPDDDDDREKGNF